MRYIFLILLTSNMFSFVITNKNKDFLPVVYLSYFDLSQTKNSEIAGEIFIDSLKNRLKKVNANFLFLKKEKFDIMIKISYRVDTERLSIFLSFYDSEEKLILEKNVFSYTDRRIFDGVDESLKIINNFVKDIEIFSPIVEEKLSGVVHFSNFRVGKENYFLYINDNLVSKYVNKDFNKYITLEANKKYIIKLLKDNNDRLVFEKEIFVEKGKTIEIEYEGKGAILVEKIKNPEMWRSYKYYFNDQEITVGVEINNLKAGEHYNFIVKDNFDRIVYKDFIYLEDGELKIIKPELSWNDAIRIKFFSVVNEYWAIGVDYNFMRYFSCGVNIGFNSFYYDRQTMDVKFLSGEVGYYFFTDRIYNFKAGVGLTGQYFFADYLIPDLKYVTKNGLSFQVNVELFNFFIKPAVFYDFSQFYFQVSTGLYIKFDL
ncbi:MAG: hypothetical protein N2258_06505 [Brevinematales bacterium]|nr:hypothetical protein [Brevinematales bacterium]